MDKSESIKELAAALSKAQGAIEGAVKDTSNPFFKSKYADLASVWAAIRKPLAENGLSVTQFVEDTDHGIGVSTMLMHSSGEWVSSKFSMPVSKVDAQGVGSAITYARRYALAAVCGVAPEDDDGNAASASVPNAQQAQKKTEKQSSKATPAGGAWESLTLDQQTQLADIVDCVRNEFNQKGADAAAKLWADETVDLEATEKVAAWNKFPSNERSAMKSASTAAKQEKTA